MITNDIDADLPHRVIYFQCGKYTTRVFGNKEQAERFASSYSGATIQLASEQPNYPKSGRKLMDNAQAGERIPCSCGKGNRLRSEEHCYKCRATYHPRPGREQELKNKRRNAWGAVKK